MSEIETLVQILQDSLDAAGIHDAEPSELPERIRELRFIGTTFVYQGEYPRRDNTGPQAAPEVDRRRYPSPKLNGELSLGE